MSQVTLNSLTYAFVFGLCLTIVQSGCNGKQQCDGEDFVKSDAQMEAMEQCSKDLEITDKKEIYKHPCFELCKLTKLKVIVEGKIEDDGLNTMAEAFPAKNQEAIKQIFGDCETNNPGPYTMDDSSCSSFQSFRKCMWAGVMDVCKWKKQ